MLGAWVGDSPLNLINNQATALSQFIQYDMSLLKHSIGSSSYPVMGLPKAHEGVLQLGAVVKGKRRPRWITALRASAASVISGITLCCCGIVIFVQHLVVWTNHFGTRRA